MKSIIHVPNHLPDKDSKDLTRILIEIGLAICILSFLGF